MPTVTASRVASDTRRQLPATATSKPPNASTGIGGLSTSRNLAAETAVAGSAPGALPDPPKQRICIARRHQQVDVLDVRHMPRAAPTALPMIHHGSIACEAASLISRAFRQVRESLPLALPVGVAAPFNSRHKNTQHQRLDFALRVAEHGRGGACRKGDIMHNGMMVLAALGLVLDGCSSRPREFTPNLGIAPIDQAKFDAAYGECKQLFVAGKLDTSGRLAVGLAPLLFVLLLEPPRWTSAGLYGGMAVMQRRWC